MTLRTTPSISGTITAALIALLAGLALSMPSLGVAASADRETASKRSPASTQKRTPAPIYWGAQIGPQLTGDSAPWDMRAVQKFQGLTRKPPSLISFSAPFTDCTTRPCTPYTFPTTPLENVRAYGAIPMFNWSSEGRLGGANAPAFRLAKIINGSYDAYIRSFAAGAAAWGHPFFLRFNWEMNGYWFPWSETANGNRRGQYVAAWRHVHDIFASVGATNASWVWCPNVDIRGEFQPLRSLYPGNSYVDWTCIDGFNWGKTAKSHGWMSFDRIYRSTYRRIAKIAPRKPMMIGEVGSEERGGSKAAWIRHMLRVIPNRYRKIRGIVWYNERDQGMRWPIESSRASRRAFAKGIRRSLYQPNIFAGLSANPIPPPPRSAQPLFERLQLRGDLRR